MCFKCYVSMRYHIKEGSTVRELTKKRDLAKTARLSSGEGGGLFSVKTRVFFPFHAPTRATSV